MTENISTIKESSFLGLEKATVLQLTRFVAIGALNTSLDFLIFNLLTTYFGVNFGGWLVVINIVGFVLALIHSYLWNRGWTFAGSEDIKQTFLKASGLLFLAIAVLAIAVLGSKFGLSPFGFLITLVLFILFEFLFWRGFDIHLQPENKSFAEFSRFLGVSLVGLGINSGVLLASAYLLIPFSGMIGGEGLVKNLAKAAATGFSLIWNFIGYKIFVFKK